MAAIIHGGSVSMANRIARYVEPQMNQTAAKLSKRRSGIYLT